MGKEILWDVLCAGLRGEEARGVDLESRLSELDELLVFPLTHPDRMEEGGQGEHDEVQDGQGDHSILR